ncbi:MAG TPA: rhodanese-like domain-containing protein [Pyrinomonadaceae bacterium]|jgi:3-mercaptopyruvate sulfurtransferase SseA|nr:rhodanese-like domain-containing protein [Pyrinomonadaceae bacterium]
MRLFVSLSAAMMFAVLVLTACNSLEQQHTGATGGAGNVSSAPTINSNAQQAANVPGDGVRRVTTVELKNMMDKGEAVVVDVRGDSAWETGHIRGSRHIPTEKILSEADNLPRDKTIITYCS